jgi:hypothetical protein
MGQKGSALAWDPKKKDSDVELSNGGRTARDAGTGYGYGSVLSLQALPPQKSTRWLVEVDKLGDGACVGVATAGADLSCYIGDDACGASFDERGTFLHQGHAQHDKRVGPTFSAGDTLSVEVNRATGALTLTNTRTNESSTIICDFIRSPGDPVFAAATVWRGASLTLVKQQKQSKTVSQSRLEHTPHTSPEAQFSFFVECGLRGL